MTDKLWARAYPPGVPAEIDPDRYPSLCDLLDASFARYAAAPAFSNLGTKLTFAEVDRLSRAFAAYLQSLPGVEKGERVAVMLPNTLQSPVALFGALRAGLIVVNVNPQYTVPELEHQLADSGARVIVVLENFAPTVEHALPNTQVRHVIVSRIGDHLPWPKRAIVNFVVKHVQRRVPITHIPNAIAYRDALARGARLPFRRPEVRGADVAFLQYTGGTTGRREGRDAHAPQPRREHVAMRGVGRALLRREGAAVVITPLPIYHVYSLTANVPVLRGGRRAQRLDHRPARSARVGEALSPHARRVHDRR